MNLTTQKRNSALIKISLWLLTFLAAIPLWWLLQNMRDIDLAAIANYQEGIVFRWLRETSIFVLSALILAVTTSVTAGFALAVLDVPFRRSLLFLTLVTMLIPVTALAMPLYVMVDKIGFNDNILGLILASAYFPFGAFLSYLYFSASLPVDLIGMGRIDGLGDLGIYRHLGLPLAKSLIGLVTFFSFISLWGSSHLPRVLLTDPTQSILSIGIEAFFNQGSALIALLMIIPSITLYLIAQRSIARGIFSGAVKE